MQSPCIVMHADDAACFMSKGQAPVSGAGVIGSRAEPLSGSGLLMRDASKDSPVSSDPAGEHCHPTARTAYRGW